MHYVPHTIPVIFDGIQFKLRTHTNEIHGKYDILHITFNKLYFTHKLHTQPTMWKFTRTNSFDLTINAPGHTGRGDGENSQTALHVVSMGAKVSWLAVLPLPSPSSPSPL